MRDLILLAIFAAVALYALRRPWVGAVMSAGISLMSPHVEFGYSAASWPVAQLVAVGTLIGLAISRDRQNPFLGAPVAWLTAFIVWICITLPFSFYFDMSLPLWERSMKIFVLVFVALALINDQRKLNVFIIVVVVSLAYYGVKGGIFTLLTGGNYRVWGPGGFVEGNNELALALVMLLPLVRYLQMHTANRWGRLAALGTLLLLPVTILGSHSRGALLALGCTALFLWLKGDRKLLWGAVLTVVGVLALALMPAHWWSRMETIQTYDTDTSALGRINAWWNAWNLASDNFFGGGFDIYTAEVFARYAPDPKAVHAAHSIYFQVLGEHGFVGLFLYLAIGVSTWLTCRKVSKLARGRPELKSLGDLGSMLQVSMVGYATGGAFLSLAYFDLPYYLMAASVATLAVAHRLSVQPVAPAQPAPMPSLDASRSVVPR